ncbi:MAG: DNA topoisomerase [Lachnospiraceae bacterium]|nr:DNA topoisomerase [Lachnospiraceae bacterium]
MQLVIAEKPGVAQAIAGVIGAGDKKDGYMEGNGYIVSWCVGHLVELAQPDAYFDAWKKWSYDSLPMIPEKWQHEVKRETAAQYKVLRGLLHEARVDSVVCATDAGREGELIFRLVYEMAGCRKPMKRLWISSMEDSAIREGFAHLKPGSDYDNLYRSALCRQQADWLVGLNGTRLFTVLYGGKVLKVGRVQTPTLAMLVDREEKIRTFKKEQYYVAHILSNGIDAVTERMDSKAQAENYEKKLCTYPRTDSQYLSDDMADTAENVIKAVFDTMAFVPQVMFHPDIKRVLNSKKVTDHHAIIPTMEITRADLGAVPDGEKQILFLVAGRLLCATGEKHSYETVKAELSCNGVVFKAHGKSVVNNGWKIFEDSFKAFYKGKVEKEDTDEDVKMPEMYEGMVVEGVQTKVTEHYTQPPKHYTDVIHFESRQWKYSKCKGAG